MPALRTARWVLARPRRRLLALVVLLNIVAVIAHRLFFASLDDPAGSLTKAKAKANPAVLPPKLLRLKHPLTPMAYGANARPRLADLPDELVADVPPVLLPWASSLSGRLPKNSWVDALAGGNLGIGGSKARRLVFVGDVHGHLAALKDLLAKVGFDRAAGDMLVLTGDLVNKGPNSAGVVQLAMDLSAYAVRGNHEDKVLLARRAIAKEAIPAEVETPRATDGAGSLLDKIIGKDVAAQAKPEDHDILERKDKDETINPKAPSSPKPPLPKGFLSHGDERARATAASLSPAHIAWLSALPVLLRIPLSPSAHPSTSAPWTARELIVAHAGVAPGTPLSHQDAWANKNMRSLVAPGPAARREVVVKALTLWNRMVAPRRRVGVDAAQIDAEMAAWRDRERAKLVEKAEKEGRVQAEQEEMNPWAGEADVLVPVDGREGEPWSGVWNYVQNGLEKEEERVVVVYGHDAKAGLQVNVNVVLTTADEEAEGGEEGDKLVGEEAKGSERDGSKMKNKLRGTRYAFGLDSGCVYGRQLTALVLEVAAGAIVHSVVQVECAAMVKLDEAKEKAKAQAEQ